MSSARTKHEEDDHGREASRPGQLGTRGYLDVARRAAGEVKRDRITLIAGGVAFYAFFAVFPALAAIVSLYGLIAEPEQVEQQVQAMGGMLPQGVMDIVRAQLQRVAAGSTSALSWGFLTSLLLTLWSTNKGIKGMMEAMNAVYDEQERRGFFKLNAVSLLLTFGGIVMAVVAIAFVVAVPVLLGQVGLGSVASNAVALLRWPILGAALLLGLSVVYRYGPSRHRARWSWITPGSVTAVVLWLLVSAGFSVYVANFNSYGKTFGSLGAVAILLMWFYLSAFVILVGAEINAQAELQTRHDTTTGPSRPMGRRGARVADRLAENPP